MSEYLRPVAFDIETTGFAADDNITVLGLKLPDGCRVILNTGGQTVDTEQLEYRQGQVFETTIELTTHQSEYEACESFRKASQKYLTQREYLLTAFNAERWGGGFDFPFVRTRFAKHDLEWPFQDVPYADLFPLFERRFNTTIRQKNQLADSTEEVTGLEELYSLLIDGELTEQDPFESSAQAVDSFETGRFEELIQHNIADIMRTEALAQVAERYCSGADFSVKSLTANIQNFQ